MRIRLIDMKVEFVMIRLIDMKVEFICQKVDFI